jgi:hypothetical protein
MYFPSGLAIAMRDPEAATTDPNDQPRSALMTWLETHWTGLLVQYQIWTYPEQEAIKASWWTMNLVRVL